jgi:hypothetical protein
VSSPAEYRRNAADCLWLARHTADSVSKVLYLQMAQAWAGLVELAESEPARYAALASEMPDLDEAYGPASKPTGQPTY